MTVAAGLLQLPCKGLPLMSLQFLQSGIFLAGADFVSREASEPGRARAGYLSIFSRAPGRALGAWACGPGRPGARGAQGADCVHPGRGPS